MRLKNKYSPIAFLPPKRDLYDEWRVIVDPMIADGGYFVNTYSEVFSFMYGDILKPILNHHGYLIVSMDGKDHDKNRRYQRKIHRLSMIAFNPVPGYENLQINHIDGNKLNNHISNLEWVTAKENISHAERLGLRRVPDPNNRITPEIALNVKLLLKDGYTHKQIVDIIGKDIISITVVDNIATGKSWINV